MTIWLEYMIQYTQNWYSKLYYIVSQLQINQQDFEFQNTMKSSTIAQKLNLQQLMVSLKMLNEESDQSRQQTFQPHFGEDSRYSNASMSKRNVGLGNDSENDDNILRDYCRKETHSQWSQGHEVSQLVQLKEINKKLFSDNKALINECIRLRKIVKDANFRTDKQIECQQSTSLQLKNLEYQNEINMLRIQNIYLKLFPNRADNKHHYNSQNKNALIELEQLKQKITQILIKIEGLENDRKNKHSRCNTTTTAASRFEIEGDRDRMISNIKIVYEDKIRILQNEIMTQKQQISRLHKNTVSQPNRAPFVTKYNLN